MNFHGQTPNPASGTGEQPLVGFIPVTHQVACEQLAEQSERAQSGNSIFKNYGGVNAFDLVLSELAFAQTDADQLYPGDYGRDLQPSGMYGDMSREFDSRQHSCSNVQTSLNGFEIRNGALTKAYNEIVAMNIPEQVKEELIRDVISSAIEYRGVVTTGAKSRNGKVGAGSEMRGPVVLNVKGMCTLPVLDEKGIRVGSVVEAVPMTPKEHLHMAKYQRHNSRFVSAKAQLIAREVTRQSIATRISDTSALFFAYYQQLVSAFGLNSLTMQRLAAINGIHRFAMFAGAQMMGYFAEKGLITSIAGRDFSTTGVAEFTAAEKALVRDALTATATTGDIGPSAKYAEIAPVLAVLLGAIPTSVSTATPFDISTRNKLNNVEIKQLFMNIAKDISRRCVNPGKSSKNSDHKHGIQQLTMNVGPAPDFAYKATTVSADTRETIPDTSTIAGKFLEFQMNQPMDLLLSTLTSIGVFGFRNIVGGATSSGRFLGGLGQVNVILDTPVTIR